MARLFRRMEQWEPLVQILREHAEVTDDPAERMPLLVLISEVAQEHLHDSELVKGTLEEVLVTEPDNADALDVLYRLYEREGDWERCTETLDRQASLIAEGDVRRRAGLMHRRGELLGDQLGRQDEAIQTFLAALEVYPGGTATIERLLEHYEAQGDWSGVAEMLAAQAQGVTEDADKAQAFKRLAAVAQEHLADGERAMRALEAACQLTPDDPEVTKPLVDSYVESGRLEEAKPLLDALVAALKQQRKLKDVYVYLHLRGQVLEQQSDEEGARSDFEAAHAANATYVPNLLSLGKSYFRGEVWKPALKVFRTLLLHQSNLSGNTQKADVFWYLGRIHQEKGDARRAKDMFNRALAVAPGHGPTMAALEKLSD